MAGLSGEELEDYTQARMVWNANLPTVRTTQLDLAYGIIEQVMASGYRDGDRLRGSVVIDAAPGLGKTTIATRYARDFHRRQYRREGPDKPDGHQRLPVAFIPLSAGITLKGLNQKLLQFYGHPGADRATTSRLASLAVDCVTSCATRLIVIDDLHFVDFKHRDGVEVSNHLKWLANEMPVTFIYTEATCLKKRKTPADQGFYAFSGFGFWLLQGQWDRGADEFECSAPGGGGYGEQVEAGLVLAGDA